MNHQITTDKHFIAKPEVQGDHQLLQNFELRNRITEIEAPKSEEETVALLRDLAEQRSRASNQLELLKKLDGLNPQTLTAQEKNKFIEKFKGRSPFRDGDRFHDTLDLKLFEDSASELPIFAAGIGIGGTIFSWSTLVPSVFAACANMPPIAQYGLSGLAGIGLALVSFFPVLTSRWLIRTAEDIVTSVYDLITTPFKLMNADMVDDAQGVKSLVKDIEVISEAKEVSSKDKTALIEQMILARGQEIAYLDETIHRLASTAPENDVETFGAVVARGLEVENPVITSTENLVELIFESKNVPSVCEEIMRHLVSSRDDILAGVFKSSSTGRSEVDAALNSRLIKIINSPGLSRIDGLKELQEEVQGLQNAYKEIEEKN